MSRQFFHIVFNISVTINKQVQSKMSKEGAEAQKTEDETEPIRENNGHASRETVQPHQQNANDIQSQQSRKAESSKCDSDDGEDDDILEESQDKRWSKRREKVKQRDIPGVDVAYLAMDNETGNEVVWNEVQFSERKNFKEQEEKLKLVFDNLTRLNHINLVKFHKYWVDVKSDKPRIIFITEYMPSGTMFRFLQRARSSGTLLNIKTWKNWTSQILSALSYLHTCDPPIVHANLSCNTVFIQQNGLVKIGCVAPNFIHHHVKTFRENIKNIHYMAPEYDQMVEATTQADIYSFGICALEMATSGALQSVGANGTCHAAELGGTVTAHPQPAGHVTPEMIRKALDSIEDSEQRTFIATCLNPDPKRRAIARDLVSWLERIGPPTEPPQNDNTEEGLEPLPEDDFHSQSHPHPSTSITDENHISHQHNYRPIDQEHTKREGKANSPDLIPKEATTSSAIAQHSEQNHILTGLTSNNGYSSATPVETVVEPNNGANTFPHSHSQHHISIPMANDRDEGYHTVQSNFGVGAGGFTITHHLNGGTLITTERTSAQAGETRLIIGMRAAINDSSMLTICLQLDDLMNRKLTTRIEPEDTAEKLVIDLIHNGFISEVDSEKLVSLLQSVIEESRRRQNTSCDI